jgi:16S rRNA A1518/A1519 N6-dimethyltransferase RsmA/KsgA/DIM1 with predicted DNA glycosylase/AP lyase activity
VLGIGGALGFVDLDDSGDDFAGFFNEHGIADADSILESLGIAPTARPETLSPEQFHQLSRTISV